MRRVRFLTLTVAVLTLLAGLVAVPALAVTEVVETTLVSVSSETTEGDDRSESPAISADGSTVVFQSWASNLAIGDDNGAIDVFVYDVDTDTTTLISRAADGTPANGESGNPSVSADGGTIVFQSAATDLVAGDTNGTYDIFAYDVATGTITLISGTIGDQTDGLSTEPDVSADGGIIAFTSDATNLVTGDTNGVSDVFVYDVATGTTTRVSVDSAGNQATVGASSPAISDDGNRVAFFSATVEGDVFLHDMTSGATTQVSVATNGDPADEWSFAPAISGDGGTVTFNSYATNLVTDPTNNTRHVYAHDVATGTTALVSATPAGVPGDRRSAGPDASGDGSIVAYYSDATNLIVGDTNNLGDVYLTDTTTSTTTRLSVGLGGTETDGYSGGPAVSADGSIVAYYSEAANLVVDDNNGFGDVFVHNTGSGTTTRVSVTHGATQSNGFSNGYSISGDGDIVAFWSDADNLVPGDTNGYLDIFAHNIATGRTTRVSVASDGTQSNHESSAAAISGDGSTVVYYSEASNLVDTDTNGFEDVFSYDLATGVTTRVSVATGGTQAEGGSSYSAAISADGSTIAYYSYATNLVSLDTNGVGDVFVYDVETDTTTRVSVATDGTQSNGHSHSPSISADGFTIAYVSSASNLVAGDTNGWPDVFVHDVATGVTTRVSDATDGTQANDASYSVSLSGDGSAVAFMSYATNLTAGDTNAAPDVFVHDRDASSTSRISVAPGGGQADGGSDSPAFSADGSVVAFESGAANLITGDTNNATDVFTYEIATGETSRVSLSTNGIQANAASGFPAMSADGSIVGYWSNADNLVASDTNDTRDVFVTRVNRSPDATGFTKSLAEDKPVGTVVGTVAGSDPDGDTLSYTITAGNSGGLFSIGSSTGTIKTAKALDYETATKHTLSVTASDGSLTDTATVTVNVTNINETPTATGFTKTLAEDAAVGTAVGTVVGSDPDGDTLTFTITAGNGGGLFAIGSTTGKVTVTKALDYETATKHTLTVKGSDGSLSGTATVTITVTDVDETSPDPDDPIVPNPDYDPFDDDNGSVFEDDIEWLSLSGITAGCGTRIFCPKLTVTRGQMAAFLTRALGLPAATQDWFTDDETSIFEDDINRLAESGITKGCGTTTFCPTGNVTRGQMAAFLVRAFGYTDDGGGDLFGDDDTSIFEGDIDKLATAGVTLGCNPPANTNFCPLGHVTREQMAAFLHRAIE